MNGHGHANWSKDLSPATHCALPTLRVTPIPHTPHDRKRNDSDETPFQPVQYLPFQSMDSLALWLHSKQESEHDTDHNSADHLRSVPRPAVANHDDSLHKNEHE